VLEAGEMDAFHNGYFDPESLATMCAALEDAWRNVPADKKNADRKSALAKAIMHCAAQGARDEFQLSLYGFMAVMEPQAERYDFQVLSGDETIATRRMMIRGAKELWPQIAELAEVCAPGCRIRVADPSGETIIHVGVATARRTLMFQDG
jgi:hypothetical protein